MGSILVTGTSQGIGFETVLELARAGHRVYATLRAPEKSPELPAIVARERLPVTIHRLDVDSDSSVTETFAEVLKDGDLDALVNNAGIERLGTVEEAPLQAFRDSMETNYFGVIRCLQAVLPRMRERRSGCIVNVSSVAGHISLAPMAPYSASKFALEALSECLAQEVTAFNIRVAIVEPGIIATRMARNIAGLQAESKYPHGRRVAGMFTEALAASPGPELVAQKIREIIESDSAPLRHPTGPDAIPFLAWRAAQSDEQWVNFGSQTDEQWTAQVARDFGLQVKLQRY